MRWWQALAVIGGTLIASPGIYWWENRKEEKSMAARGLLKPDAPGQFLIAAPVAGCAKDTVVGTIVTDGAGRTHATGPCCHNPKWIPAASVMDEDHVPCCACGIGVMVVIADYMH